MKDTLLGLAHIGVKISDAEVSKDFYVNKLNFTLRAEHTLSNGVKLIFVDAGSCELELICPPTSKGKIPAGVVDHIAIECKNIEGWVAHLKEQGVALESETIGVMNDLLGGVKNVFFAGPDGERIELFEYRS